MGLGKGVQAEVLVKAQQEVGEVMGELGLAFIKVAKFEMEAGFTPVHAADAKCVATGAVKASRFYRECTAQCVQHLVRHLAPNCFPTSVFNLTPSRQGLWSTSDFQMLLGEPSLQRNTTVSPLHVSCQTLSLHLDHDDFTCDALTSKKSEGDVLLSIGFARA
jgi:hypothetical protein